MLLISFELFLMNMYPLICKYCHISFMQVRIIITICRVSFLRSYTWTLAVILTSQYICHWICPMYMKVSAHIVTSARLRTFVSRWCWAFCFQNLTQNSKFCIGIFEKYASAFLGKSHPTHSVRQRSIKLPTLIRENSL